MNTDTVKLTIRLPGGMHARLKRAASRDHRSLNEQMLHYLALCLDQEEHDRHEGVHHGR